MPISVESPLYKNVSVSERRSIQVNNFLVIKDGFSRYTPGNGEVEVFLRGLNVNGKLTDEASLRIFQNRSTTYAKVDYEGRPVCQRSFQIMMDSMIDWAEERIPFWLIENSKLKTRVGYEGNGFGKALLVGTEEIIPQWIDKLDNRNRVLALHFDGARGAEEDIKSKDGYRAGWTSTMLKSLGYSNKKSALQYYLGEKRVRAMLDIDSNWIKSFRD